MLLERLRSIAVILADVDKRIAELEAQVEKERKKLEACGAVARANTPESAKRARQRVAEYWSASLDDVINAVDEELALREQLNRRNDEKI